MKSASEIIDQYAPHLVRGKKLYEYDDVIKMLSSVTFTNHSDVYKYPAPEGNIDWKYASNSFEINKSDDEV